MLVSSTFLTLFAAVLLVVPGKAQDVPVFQVDRTESTARFAVKGTVDVNGAFESGTPR